MKKGASKKPKIVTYKRQPDRQLTATQKRELAALANLPDEKIDTSDIPELSPEDWKNAIRGKWYRPVKQPVALRLDSDILAWLKKQGPGYQTRINDILRQRMLIDLKR